MRRSSIADVLLMQSGLVLRSVGENDGRCDRPTPDCSYSRAGPTYMHLLTSKNKPSHVFVDMQNSFSIISSVYLQMIHDPRVPAPDQGSSPSDSSGLSLMNEGGNRGEDMWPGTTDTPGTYVDLISDIHLSPASLPDACRCVRP